MRPSCGRSGVLHVRRCVCVRSLFPMQLHTPAVMDTCAPPNPCNGCGFLQTSEKWAGISTIQLVAFLITHSIRLYKLLHLCVVSDSYWKSSSACGFHSQTPTEAAPNQSCNTERVFTHHNPWQPKKINPVCDNWHAGNSLHMPPAKRKKQQAETQVTTVVRVIFTVREWCSTNLWSCYS